MDAMIGILRQTKDAYQALLEQSRTKNKAIIRNDVDTITQISQTETQMIAKLDEIEKLRDAEMEKIAAESGMPKDEITLSRLMEQASEREKIQISTLKSALGKIIEEQVRLNDTNKMLIDTQLAYINFFLDVATREDLVSNNYTSGGEVKERKLTSLGIFDQEA